MKSGVLIRYKDLLPITPDTPIFSLGEGDTPLVRCDRLARKISACHPVVVNSAKEAVTRGLDVSLAEGLALEARLGKLVLSQRDN